MFGIKNKKTDLFAKPVAEKSEEIRNKIKKYKNIKHSLKGLLDVHLVDAAIRDTTNELSNYKRKEEN